MKFVLKIVLSVLLLSSPVLLAQTGYVKVRASEDNVAIEVDGKPLIRAGKQWTNLPPIAVGLRTITARKEFFEPQSQQRDIREGRVESIDFILRQPEPFSIRKSSAEIKIEYGDLTVITVPPGAQIKLRGQPIANEVAPMTLDHVYAGNAEIEASLHGRTASEQVVVEPNRLNTVTIYLDPVTRRKIQLEDEERMRLEREARERRKREEAVLAEAKAKAEVARQALLRAAEAKFEELQAALRVYARDNGRESESVRRTVGILDELFALDGFDRAKAFGTCNQTVEDLRKSNLPKAARLAHALSLFHHETEFRKTWAAFQNVIVWSQQVATGGTANLHVVDLRGQTVQVCIENVDVVRKRSPGLIDGKVTVEKASCDVTVGDLRLSFCFDGKSPTWLGRQRCGDFSFSVWARANASSFGLLDGAIGVAVDGITLGGTGDAKNMVSPKHPTVEVQISYFVGE